MMASPQAGGKPPITMTRSDHDRLTGLAETAAAKGILVAEQLFAELDRARVVADKKIPRDVVKMGSTLRFTTDRGEDRTVTLVFPGEADISLGRISILTPIGAALIGLSRGQSIDWSARGGQSNRLTVASVDAAAHLQPAGSGS